MTSSPLSIYDIAPDSTIGQMMVAHGYTFEEAFWVWFSSLDIRSETIDGYLFSFKELDPHLIGNSRSKRQLLIPSEHRAITVGNIIKICKSPLPDSARVLTTEEFRIMDDRTLPCRMKGCFDRYNCIWYNEKEAEPWNKVPEDWKIGGEMCESFVNKNLK